MKLHEYQARDLLAKHGVPVPGGRVAATPAEAREIAESLGGRVVVKAQIHAGGRGKGRLVAQDETAAMLQEATSGAEYVDMHDEVYGVLCSPLILPILNPLQDMAHGEVRTATDATSHIAEQLRTMADNVDITDSEAACRINGVRG